MSGGRGNPNPSPETRFKKGQTGNPFGRPRMPHEVRVAFQELTEAARQTLVRCLREGGSVAVQAARVILERAWGQPDIDVSLVQVEMTDEELAAKAKELLARAEGREIEAVKESAA